VMSKLSTFLGTEAIKLSLSAGLVNLLIFRPNCSK
jgi:hypothetical protein